MPRRKQRSSFDQVSEFDRGRIMAYRDCELSFREIGSRVGRNQTTVMRICDRWMQKGTTDRRVRSHTPQCTTSRADRQIVRMAVTDRSVTSRTVAQHIQSVTHHPVSARTIRRRLQQSGLSARHPLLRLPLMQNHRRLRHQWCDERRMLTAEWNEIVFTDDCVMHRHTGPAPGIVVWGSIGYHSRTPLVRIAGTLNSQRYISEVLEPVVLPYLQGLPTAIFKQDNARRYVACIVQRFFVNRQIELLPWPALSPDLSPIENMWSMVTQQLTQITSPAAIPDQLWQRVEAAWSAEYYFAKVKIATKLGPSQELILEGLTSGIDSEFERLLIAASPTSLERWLEIAEAIEVSHCRTTSAASRMELGYPARRRPSTSWQGGQGFRPRNWREGRNDRPGTHLPPTRSQTASLAAVQDHEDILSAYWTIPLHPKDREMTCFSTSEGSYVWCRLPFGLKTAPAIFNRKLSAILQKYKLDNVTSYFDDILVFSENEESHLKHLGQIFEILKKEGIQLRRDKCLLFMKRITYLGYEISENQISPSGVNVDVIKSLPPPRDLRCLRSFLGSVTHYAKFIKNFNNQRAPLNELLKKNSRFIWTEECQRSFEGLKEALCSKPILQLFNPSLATHIYCDASTSGIGALLKQEYPDGTQKPFTYFSRALRGAESKYTITELELLADRIVVPLELQDNLIQKAHEYLGHPGTSAMIRALSVQYYFKRMIGKIKNYVKNYKECQTIKSSTQPSYGLMRSLPRAAKPFDVVALDTVLGLGGYNSAKNCIHTVIDHHSRYIWGYASKGTSIATYINIINQLLNIGKPRILVTDRHPSFVLKRFNKFLQEKGIKHVMTSPSHPECNGLLERANATLIGRLKIQYQGNPRAPWPKLLQKTLEEYRDTPHSTTTFPPIYLLYGTLPSYISDLTNPYPPVEKARTIANEKTEELHKRLVKRYNISHRFPNLKMGDKVLYRIPHQVGHGKLSPVYYPDPYTVLSTPSPHIVEINKPCQPENKPSTIVNVSKLKLWDPISTSNEGLGNYPFPFQDVEDLNGCL
ncbi:hypothetical protein LAZ67_3003179 [Cordylochernes scorpioides]|uniref:RNA-directed DNA polymerase n=1 Tax=Cordylochernes scorpioides TaxID=51811 RepID=A0ABY6K8L9_9ARAC|nr:hypothetical protein LAZ67_3003179 [Cordylochernes scorpioides]